MSQVYSTAYDHFHSDVNVDDDTYNDPEVKQTKQYHARTFAYPDKTSLADFNCVYFNFNFILPKVNTDYIMQAQVT